MLLTAKKLIILSKESISGGQRLLARCEPRSPEFGGVGWRPALWWGSQQTVGPALWSWDTMRRTYFHTGHTCSSVPAQIWCKFKHWGCWTDKFKEVAPSLLAKRNEGTGWPRAPFLEYTPIDRPLPQWGHLELLWVYWSSRTSRWKESGPDSSVKDSLCCDVAFKGHEDRKVTTSHWDTLQKLQHTERRSSFLGHATQLFESLSQHAVSPMGQSSAVDGSPGHTCRKGSQCKYQTFPGALRMKVKWHLVDVRLQLRDELNKHLSESQFYRNQVSTGTNTIQ